MSLLDNDNFNFFVAAEAIQKSESPSGDDRRWIQGIASTDDLDLQDERVIQSGLDFSYFLKHGFINDDHKPGPEHKVGEPTEARITKAGFWIKGFLYKGHDRADHWWELINALEQSDAKRKIGFSIEGKIQRRDGKSILKCWIKDVAITASPVNTHTWAEIAKSLSGERWCKHPWRSNEKACKGCPGAAVKGTTCEDAKLIAITQGEDEEKALSAGGMGRVITPQSLEGRPAVQTFKSIDRISYEEAVAYLRLQKGYSEKTAAAIVNAIFSEQGLN